MRFIKRTFQLLLLVKEPPRRTALAFALGVFLGFSPLIGVHTILGLVIGQVFRLNKVTVLVGVYVNNPWLVVPYYGFATWLGVRITGLPEGASIPQIGFAEIFSAAFWRELASQYHLLFPAVLGSSLLAVPLALVAYFVCLHAIHKFARHTAAPPEP